MLLKRSISTPNTFVHQAIKSSLPNCFTKSQVELQRKSLTLKNKFFFCKGQVYIMQYTNLQKLVKERKQYVSHLEQKVELLNNMSNMSSYDRLMRLIYSYMSKQFHSKSYKEHRDLLLSLRNQLERTIDQSSEKWEEPRKKILESRQQRINEFLERLCMFDERMAKLVRQRNSKGSQQTKDIDQGLDLTHKLLQKILIKEGAEIIEPESGAQFNVAEHQVTTDKSDTQKDMSQKAAISKVVSPGWKVGSKIVCKAKVEVITK